MEGFAEGAGVGAVAEGQLDLQVVWVGHDGHPDILRDATTKKQSSQLKSMEVYMRQCFQRAEGEAI